MYVKAPLLDVAVSTKSKAFKVGVALFGGFGLVCLTVLGISAYSPVLQSTSAGDATSLIGMPGSLRSVKSACPSVSTQNLINQLPGPSPWKELALAGLEASNGCRDVSASANRFKAIMASMSPADKAVVAKAEGALKVKAQDVLKAGQTSPMGFFDPLGLSTNIDAGKLVFYREAEIKHGRVGMIATLGMFIGEKFHPLYGGPESAFGGADSTAASFMFDTNLDAFWATLLVCVALPEVTYLFAPYPLGPVPYPDGSLEDRVPGDIGWDPLNIKPKDPKLFLEMQNKELNNGRIAMLGAAGMIAQELVTGQKTFN